MRTATDSAHEVKNPTLKSDRRVELALCAAERHPSSGLSTEGTSCNLDHMANAASTPIRADAVVASAHPGELVQAVEHIRPMRGGAQSQLLRADDGHYYVVKFTNNPQHVRVLANEWLAGRLARGLGLPVPEIAVILVSESMLAASTGLALKLAGQVVPCAAGLHFGSRLPTSDPHSPIYDYLPEPGLELVENLHDFAGMLLLDKWTCNCNGRQVIFCRPSPRRNLRAYMVDQGFCFNAGEWSFPDNPLRGVYCRNRVYHGIEGWHSFEPWLERLEHFDPNAIYSACEEIPPAWYGDWSALQRLGEQLERRRSRVRELLWAVKLSPRQPFENWRELAADAVVVM